MWWVEDFIFGENVKKRLKIAWADKIVIFTWLEKGWNENRRLSHFKKGFPLNAQCWLVDSLSQSEHEKTKSRFILGRKGTEDEDSEIEDNIQKEIDEHGDIIIGDFKDTYDNLPLKVFI